RSSARRLCSCYDSPSIMNGAITPAIPRYASPTIIGARQTRAFPCLRTAAAYATFAPLPAAGLLWVLHAGHDLPGPINPVAKAVDRGPRVSFQTSLFLTQIIIIIATARLLGGALRKLGQPRVVGEMLGGLILGP